MTKETDKLDAKLDELITAKLDAALKPFLEKLDAFPKKDEDEKDPKKKKKKDGEKDEKTDSAPIKLATEILRNSLKGAIKKDKLDAMPLDQLYIANQLHSEMSAGGIRNPIKETDKTDAKSVGMWGSEIEQ